MKLMDIILPPSFPLWLTNIIHSYWTLGLTLGTFLMGENFILPVFTSLAKHTTLLFMSIPWVLLGSLAADSWWFAVGKYSLSRFPLSRPFSQEDRRLLAPETLRHIISRHPLLFLILMKFLVGLRIFLTLSLARLPQFSWPRFFWLDSIAISVFVGTLAVIGVFLGTTLPGGWSLERLLLIVAVAILILLIFGHGARRVLLHWSAISIKERSQTLE